MSQSAHLDNDDGNHLHMIRHFAQQTGSTPVHLDNESIKGLRNLHNLVHNEDVEHDFSKLKTLFTQPNIAIHLKNQIEQKKANGGVINDYINTLKHNGSGGNSELTLIPNELAKFLDDSYSLSTTNPDTGHKEYYLGKTFDSLNNIFKPIKESMRPAEQSSHLPAQESSSMQEEQPREGHGFGSMIGMPTLSGLGNAAYGLGRATASGLGNVASGLGNAAYGLGSATASGLGSATYGLGRATASGLGNVASGLGNAAYGLGSATASGLGNVASGLGNAAYNTAFGSKKDENNTPSPPPPPPPPGMIQNTMRRIAGPIGSTIGGLTGQFVAQKAGQNLGAGIPLIGPFISPIVGNIAGNMAYNTSSNLGRNKGIAAADNFYNYLSGGNASRVNSSPQNSNQASASRFPSLSGIGNAAYSAAQGLGNAAYGLGKKVYDTASNAASSLGNSIYNAGNSIYNKLPAAPRFNKSSSNINQISPSKVDTNPFANISSNNIGSNPFATSTNPFD
jgi:hypothetical protein